MRKTMAGLALPLDSVRNPKPMRKWMVRGGIFLGVLLAIAGATYYWLIDESHVPSGARFALDIGTVRQLANSIPGAKPQQIRVEQLAVLRFPASALVAGNGWSKSDITVFTYQLVYPESTAIVDTGLDQKLGHTVAQPLKLSDIPVVQALVFLCGEQHRDIALGGGLQQALAERHL